PPQRGCCGLGRESITLTDSLASSVAHTLFSPPFLHSSPFACSPPPLDASPLMVSRSRVCELNQFLKNVTGSLPNEEKNVCLDFDIETAWTSLARCSSSPATSFSIPAYPGSWMNEPIFALKGF